MQKVQKLLKTPYFLQADLQALTPGRVKKMTLYRKYENVSRPFQPGESLSRDLLRDCEILV